MILKCQIKIFMFLKFVFLDLNYVFSLFHDNYGYWILIVVFIVK